MLSVSEPNGPRRRTDSSYDALAPYYHLIYPDWEASSKRQCEALVALLSEFGIRPGDRLLDARQALARKCRASPLVLIGRAA
jgi:hypothetical protein